MGRILCALALLLQTGVLSQLKLPKLIADGMVLQRNAEFPVWGHAREGEVVTVHFQDRRITTVAKADGKWEALLKVGDAGGPFEVIISTPTETRKIKDVMVGDVYLCSGQSNMELFMGRVAPLYKEEMANAHYKGIRYFEVPKEYDFQGPRQDLSGGKWISIDTTTIAGISAVAYFFAKEIHLDEAVPVGIINASLGGSPIEAWLDIDALKAFPKAYNEAKQYRDPNFRDSIETSDRNRNKLWYDCANSEDKGLAQHWKDGGMDLSTWKEMEIPGYWGDTDLGMKNGVVWYSRAIEVPESSIGKAAPLELGRIVDADSVFLNGQFIGSTGYQYPPRRYTVPPGILQKHNQLVIRIINERGKGGFVEDKAYELRLRDTVIDLRGKWHYKLGAQLPELHPQTFIRWKATGLYNAMIAPLVRYPISGMLWYQGESNVDNAEEYDDLIKLLVRDWREKWGGDEIPFLLVQLANFLPASTHPQESVWAEMREAQGAVLELDRTAMAVITDVGEWNDIHPLNKQAVGHRLALGAKKLVYGKDVVFSGPKFASQETLGKRMKVSFDLYGSQLQVKGDTLTGFAVAGEDRKFYWADAVMDGNSVLLESREVPRPLYVRYAWADNPERANLYNTEGLPALPFRTDRPKE